MSKKRFFDILAVLYLTTCRPIILVNGVWGVLQPPPNLRGSLPAATDMLSAWGCSQYRADKFSFIALHISPITQTRGDITTRPRRAQRHSE